MAIQGFNTLGEANCHMNKLSVFHSPLNCATSSPFVSTYGFTKPTAKRKHWSNEQPKSSTKSRIEITQERAESGGENENLESQGMTKEAHELLVKPNPSSLYWKELAEEQRKPLFHALQENERLHKEIKLKDEEILQLKEQNQEIIELTDHVKYMADLIEMVLCDA
eukprot:gi/632938005/ref/XP_007901919.1/ PREDICTED: geminin-like [Callorhinchus milii]